MDEQNGGMARDDVARRAYEISQSAEAGTPEENWHRAERELRGATDPRGGIQPGADAEASGEKGSSEETEAPAAPKRTRAKKKTEDRVSS